MTQDDLKLLFAYHRWANDRMITAASSLADEQLHRNLSSSFPSVFATLQHMLMADWIWLGRWHGREFVREDAPSATTLDELRQKWNDIERGQREFIDGLDAVAIAKRISYRSLKGDAFNDGLGFTLQHVANHGTHHRGQLVTMLRQLGVTPPVLDFITFVREAL
jgi:uncharacterized damage-inducible protein DinB